MRPSSADTSEPACEKRKMLSMNSSVSAPLSSRKYSAMVSADSAARRRAPGGSFIWPKTIAVWSMTDLPVVPILASCISSHRSLPSRVRSPTPAKTEIAAVLRGDAGDQLLDDDGLAQAGPAEQADLAAADERDQQVDDLDAGLELLGLGRQVGELGRLAVDGFPAGGVDGPAAVDRLADQVEDAAERARADGDA